MNSLHSDRASFQISVVHGAPGTSVQFCSYFEVSRLVGEGERSVPQSHLGVVGPTETRPSTSCTGVCLAIIIMLQYYICLGIVLTVILVLGLGLGFGIILYFVTGT